MNIWTNIPLVTVWAGSLTLLCFAGGLLLKRKWTAGVLVAVAGPIVLVPMAFAGGLGAMALGEIIVRGGLEPLGLGHGAGPWVSGFADAVMLFLPFAMLGLYVRYESAFERAARDRAMLCARRWKRRKSALTNVRKVHIPGRRYLFPVPLPVRRRIRHHVRKVRRSPVVSNRLVVERHPRRTRGLALPHSR